jgi:hypothetical protein
MGQHTGWLDVRLGGIWATQMATCSEGYLPLCCLDLDFSPVLPLQYQLGRDASVFPGLIWCWGPALQ